MTINQIAETVHENAVRHGFWDAPVSDELAIALIHSEWSEALEELRAGRPMVYGLILDGSNDATPCLTEDAAEIRTRGLKPEGVAVELIDGCIRILDLFGAKGWMVRNNADDAPSTLKSLYEDEDIRAETSIDAAHLIARLHMATSEALKELQKGDEQEAMYCLMVAICDAMRWIDARGLDPMALLALKHDDNVTRPIRHGKRF